METIKSKRDFGRVFHEGKRAGHRLVRITAHQRNGGGPTRVAFVAPKRLGTAVFRNRCKRVLREAARVADLPQEGFDVLFFATRNTHDAHPDDVARAMGLTMRRAAPGAGTEANR